MAFLVVKFPRWNAKAKDHSFYKQQCLHDLQFMKKIYFSPNLSKLARADISCQFMKTRSLCRTVYAINGLYYAHLCKIQSKNTFLHLSKP